MSLPPDDYFIFKPFEEKILEKLQEPSYTTYEVADDAVSLPKQVFIFFKDLCSSDFDKHAWYEAKGEKVVKKIYTKLYLKEHPAISQHERVLIHRIFKKIHLDSLPSGEDQKTARKEQETAFHKKLAICLEMLQNNAIDFTKTALQEKSLSFIIAFKENHAKSAFIINKKVLEKLNECKEGEEAKRILEDAALKALKKTCTKEQKDLIDSLEPKGKENLSEAIQENPLFILLSNQDAVVKESLPKEKVQDAYKDYASLILQKSPDALKDPLLFMSIHCGELFCDSKSPKTTFLHYFTWMELLIQNIKDKERGTFFETVEDIAYVKKLFHTYSHLQSYPPEILAKSMSSLYSVKKSSAYNKEAVENKCKHLISLFPESSSQEERMLGLQLLHRIEKRMPLQRISLQGEDEALFKTAIEEVIFLRKEGFEDASCINLLEHLFFVERGKNKPIQEKLQSLHDHSRRSFSSKISLEKIQERFQKEPLLLLSNFLKGLIRGFYSDNQEAGNKALKEIERNIEILEEKIQGKELLLPNEKSMLLFTLQLFITNQDIASFLSDIIDLVQEYLPHGKTIPIEQDNPIQNILDLATEERVKDLLSLVKDTFFEQSVKGDLLELFIGEKEAWLKTTLQDNIKALFTYLGPSPINDYILKESERISEILFLMTPLLITLIEQLLPHTFLISEEQKEAIINLIQWTNDPLSSIEKILPLIKPLIIQIVQYGFLGITNPEFEVVPKPPLKPSTLSLSHVREKWCQDPVGIVFAFSSALANAFHVPLPPEFLQEFKGHCPTVTEKCKKFLEEWGKSQKSTETFLGCSIYFREALRSEGVSSLLTNILFIIQEKLKLLQTQPLSEENFFEKTILHTAKAIIDPEAPIEDPIVQLLKPYIELLPTIVNKITPLQEEKRKEGFISWIRSGISTTEWLLSLVQSKNEPEDPPSSSWLEWGGQLIKKTAQWGVKKTAEWAMGKPPEELIKDGIKKYIVVPLKLNEKEAEELTNGIFTMLPTLLPLLKIVPELLERHSLDGILNAIVFLGNAKERTPTEVARCLLYLLQEIMRELNDVERFALEESLFAVAQQMTTSS